MRDIPLDVILSFPPANYDNPHTRGPALLIINSIFLVLCTVFVALRMYTRIHLVRTFGWDDVSLLVGFVFAVGLAANVMLANNNFYWYASSSSYCLQNQLTDKIFKGIATFGIFPSLQLQVSITRSQPSSRTR
jgi:hypothetical protein